MASTSRNWEVQVMIADPTDHGSLVSRARHVMLQKGIAPSEQPSDEVYERLISDIEVGLVGLYLVRAKCTKIEIVAMQNPTTDRFEIFDDSIWITLFSSITGPAVTYPKTLRFGAESFVYKMERADFLRICNSDSAKQGSISPRTRKDDFSRVYRHLTGKELTDELLNDLTDKFEAFHRAFFEEAELEKP
jgi:hypothetical protein